MSATADSDNSAASPRVVALCADLFFTSRIASAARGLDLPFVSVRTIEGLSAQLAHSTPDLVLVDLSTFGEAVAEAVAAARARSVPRVVAYGPHRDVESRARALAAGCDEWLPNSKLAGSLPQLLQRHAGLGDVAAD